MRPGDYSLRFLEELGPSFSAQDVDNAWDDRVFPLVHTEDFQRNWQHVEDSHGIFLHHSGHRCRVDSRPHHLKACQVRSRQKGASHQYAISYEAIVFAKAAYQLHLNSTTTQKDSTPTVVDHRRFVDVFVKKLPSRWQKLVVQCDLHLYNENPGPAPSLSAGLGIYQPLSRPGNIRLLKLMPAQDSWAPLECTLAEAQLPPSSAYEALSYVWGSNSPDTAKSIQLNGTTFPIGENLEAALRQLRPCRDTGSRVMWVDAVCIDQSNDEERAEQVAQMDEVYRNAENVVVWLGRETNTSARIFASVHAIKAVLGEAVHLLESQSALELPFGPVRDKCQGFHDPNCQLRKISKSPESELSAGDKEMRPVLQKILTGLPTVPKTLTAEAAIELAEGWLKILSRPWWQRVWVLQELILAKKVVVYCGPKSLDWQTFQAALFTVIRLGRRTEVYAEGSPSHRSRESAAFFVLLENVRSAFPFFFLQSKSLLADRVQSISMAELLSLTARFEATDPRDKLFALVGLLPRGSAERSAFGPDYSTSLRQVYTRAARHWLKTTSGLDIVVAWAKIPDYFRPPPGVKLPLLPSWVPDFSLPRIFQYSSIWIGAFSPYRAIDTYVRSRQVAQKPDADEQNAQKGGREFSRLQLYNASLHERSPFPLEFDGFGEVLLTRGVTVDSISQVGLVWDLGLLAARERIPGSREQSAAAIHSAHMGTLQQWKSAAGLEEEGRYPFTGQPRDEAFWRTIFLDRFRSPSSLDDGLRLGRIPDKNGDEKVRALFPPWAPGSTCHFPPHSPQEEGRLVSYLRSELIELWNFASLNLHSANLRLFRTAKGYIGIGHPNVRTRDKVVILLGAAVPFVLREYPQGNMVVGESYVHGIMDGEIVKDRMDSTQKRGLNLFEQFRII